MNNIGQTLACLFLCCFFYGKNSAQTPSSSIATWKDNNKAAYTIFHDDYSDYVTGIFQYAYPNATQRGIKICFGAITNSCGDEEWEHARTMITQGGHECVNHSHSHFCALCSNANTCVTNFGCGGLTTYSVPQFNFEIKQADSIIQANTGKKPRFFIHPYDNYTSEEIDYLKNLGYLGTRGGLQLTYNTPNYADPYFMNYYVYGPDNQLTLAELNAAIDETVAAGGHAMREFHGINDGSWGQIPLATYTSHLDYVKSKMDAKLIWSATISDVLTYKMQREVYETATHYNTQSGVLTVNFNQNLANLQGVSPTLFTPSVFTTPITLNIDVTGIAGTLPLNAVQNNKSVSFIKTGNIISLNVYPHEGSVVFNIDLCGGDIMNPVFTNCPSNINLTTSGTSAIATWAIPTATDNCTASPSVTTTHASGTAFPVGETTVLYTAKDAKLNVGTCSFKINVTYINPCDTDTVKPVFTNCPNNIILTTSGTNAIANWTAPTATDNCTATPSVIGSHTSGTTFPTGLTTVTYTATDAKNNVETCSFGVKVIFANPCDTDTVKPVFTNCPNNIILSTFGNSTVVNWTPPTVSDNCTANPTLISSHNSGAIFPLGETTVTYTATDTKNNIGICVFKITINLLNACDADTVKPVFINCPGNITVITPTTSGIANWTPPTASDNCTVTPSVISTHNSGAIFPVGLTTITYTATDAKNNVGTCSFGVKVIFANPCDTDTVKPVFNNCPANITLTTTGTTAVATWNLPIVTDNCTLTPSVTGTHLRGSAFPLGETIVSYTATDAKNNVAICSFKTTVISTNDCANDIVKPVFSNCPSNINLTTTGTSAIATWATPIATDNCTANPSILSTHNSGFDFSIGTTTVIYRADDAKGNFSTCAFTVTVTAVQINPCDNDVVKPVFTNCPTNISLSTTGTTATATWAAPTATDNCTIPPAVFSTHNSGFAFPIGATTVTYTALDAKNNTQTCSFTVTVLKINADLGLSMTVARGTGTRQNMGDFKITIKNFGTTAFTSITVKIPFPEAAYTSGTASGTLGNWRQYRNGIRVTEWTMPSLAPNATAFLNVPLDLTKLGKDTVITAYILSSTPADLNTINNSVSIRLSQVPLALLSANALEIDATVELKKVKIDWVSQSIENIDYFAIQKMDTLLGDFKDLEIFKSASLENLQHHTVYDAQPNEGDNFYRIKQVFFSGRVVFSAVKKVVFGSSPFFNVYPNPTDSELNIDFKNYKGKKVEVHLYNTIGQEVFTKMLENVGDTPYIFDISKLNEGQYLIRVVSKGRVDAVKMVSIVR
jgi:peptidoglycan/xylan/chitin deacetylase (PgdA/CDA1 family)